ncbi:MAG TPA: hypothetical protein VFS20_11905 [Longimicrobium sp.]|nr:hypothetical protein [Longimicrobium sp.]
MRAPPPGWPRVAAAGAVVALGAAASLYVIRALKERERQTGTGRAPTAGRPLTVIRGGAGEG